MASESNPAEPIPSGPKEAGEAPKTEVDPPPTVTWDTTIKGYFLPSDVQCMLDNGGFDLSSKSDVTNNADDIYTQVSNKFMPKQMPPFTQQNPDPKHPLWTQEMCDNFKAWMNGGFQ
ncbi:hypothetical protein B0H66DRAFT_511291 [Apodospora peruviana]|uniref:Uncharacterized protein n=1 Tax=Apodospora peruviana TaxID=516989 RepID=A0AAE0IHW0_9PEZI|nr:hypothetical protein B0H66DRAFT_511291 [Apodospora peruviana]